jgi:hypothetical protein
MKYFLKKTIPGSRAKVLPMGHMLNMPENIVSPSDIL